MTRKVLTTAFAVTAACLVFSGLAFAKAREIQLAYPAKLANGPEIQPGSYKVDVLNNQPTPEVVFYRGKEVVARTPAKLVELPRKSDQTQIHSKMEGDSRLITEIRLEGWKEKLLFDEPTQTDQSGR
ncbi:MAG: hypothetical protein HY508_08885 [Acidobacteria bacterium]|nr:hypothetical protein [Acidobacteriota bacterium]